MRKPIQPIVIIGGGVAGLMAARVLMEAGEEVVVLDKGRSGGGRMATRRIGEATLDHGAQYFTVRSPEFAKEVAKWEEEGWVTPWFGTQHVRYRACGGMNRLTKHLAEPLDIGVRVRVTAVHPDPAGWKLDWVSEEQDFVPQMYDEVMPEDVYDPGAKASVKARAVILTAPVKQALYILRAGETELPAPLLDELQAVDYLPCLAALVVLDGPSAVPEPGLWRADHPDSPVQLVVDNSMKGVSARTALTVYACGRWSKEHFNEPDEEIMRRLLADAAPWFNKVNIVEAQLKRWRFSLVDKPYPGLFADAGLQAPLILAGDAFISPDDSAQSGRVESAALSGMAAAHHLLQVLPAVE
ncbi:NAD(P)/FAD-dependent oxidoreductase [Aneurinibacillus uraniidurans]|uniref:NAD(P)/FAD-dependent oxidoreductase n=1 Tax=Aneurinibacillus uraniidurans TaxID=2966586 RepID=UPI0023492BA3|nr:FAD-dependent oxidoreductase [Aneurinibacillus sp. B1]WCN39463.1 FAD-dependent oxidoreductase [Aneurinibacillus sp. B1]